MIGSLGENVARWDNTNLIVHLKTRASILFQQQQDTLFSLMLLFCYVIKEKMQTERQEMQLNNKETYQILTRLQ